jgi:D-alanyl-D-alanine endopeptidase (penicillin-binding protein 7)
MRKLVILFLTLCFAGAAFSAEAQIKKAAPTKKHFTQKKAERKPAAAKRASVRRVIRRSAPVLDDSLSLRSAAVLVVEQTEGRSLYDKNPEAVLPIASITKVMTAMVILDAALPLNESIQITEDDVDTLRRSSSRLRVGTKLPRREMLRLALMASENRAASALGRTYPGGTPAFIAAMNRKARELGMEKTRFVDPTGLRTENVSTAADLVKMVEAGYGYDLIREFTTTDRYELDMPGRQRALAFQNTNGLVRSDTREIGLSKTGYIRESGRCLIMQATIAAKPVIIVLLDSWGKLSRVGDANRIKKWLESSLSLPGT